MPEVGLRVPFGLGHTLKETVSRRGRHEYVAFGLVASATLASREVLLVRHIFTLPEEAYLHAPGHGGAWRGAAMIPVIETAVDEGLGLVVFHAHPHDGRPSLSDDDRKSAARLLPMFTARVPGRPHASVVLSRTSAAGLIAMPGTPVKEMMLDVRWLGGFMIDWRAGAERVATGDRAAFDRQRLVVREDGQLTLADSRIAIVGLGGGGSHVAQQLALLGVGELILIDADSVSKTDRHRLVGMTALNVWLRQSKTQVVRRAVRRSGMGTRCETVTERIPGPRALAALARADVMVGCVDNLHARADLQELAWRFLIPYVDIGVNMRAIKEPEPYGPRVSIGGNVLTLIPGGFCMWCSGFLSKKKLAAELCGPDRNYFENQAGEAQVVSLNGLVASQAVTEVLQLLTGFGGTGFRVGDITLNGHPDAQRGFRKLDGVRGTLEDWGATRRPACSFCNLTLGVGVVAWTSPR